MSRSVSILLVARDRYSMTEECLEALFRRTSAPDQIVCVDAGSPRPVADQLKALGRKHGITMLRHEAPLSANAARHLGLAHLAPSTWTALLENDVHVEPGWLDSLVNRARADSADVVVPLVNRVLPERAPLPKASFGTRPAGDGVTEIPAVLCADPAWASCMLVRGSAPQIRGFFDPSAGLVTAHWDLWLELQRRVARVAFEPQAVVASCRRAPLQTCDEEFFAQLWNDEAIRQSVEYFCDKWNLSESDPAVEMLVKQSRDLRNSLLGHYRLSRYVGQRAALWWHYVASPLQRLVSIPDTRAASEFEAA